MRQAARYHTERQFAGQRPRRSTTAAAGGTIRSRPPAGMERALPRVGCFLGTWRCIREHKIVRVSCVTIHAPGRRWDRSPAG